MTASKSLELVSRLRATQGIEDPGAALTAFFAALADFGIVPDDLASDEPWLKVEVKGHSLAVRAPSVAPEPWLREVIAALLESTLRRLSAHEDTRRIQERMDMLSAASFEGIMIHEAGLIVDANQRLSEMLGYELSEIIGKELIPMCAAPEDVPRVLARVVARLEGDYVITGIRKDGSRFRAEILSKQGHLGERPIRVAAVRDVTLRERNAELLRESENRLRLLAEEAFDCIVLSRDGVIVDTGGDISGMLGYEVEAVIGRRITEFVNPPMIPFINQVIAERREGAIESEVVRPDGSTVPVSVVGVMSTLEGEPVRVAGLRDLSESRRLESERRQLEQQLEQSQRLESLGVLAGGVAHDFNNLLVGVLGNAEVLLERAPEAFERECLQEIMLAGERAAALTRKMLAYAGHRELGRREPVDLAQLWLELRRLVDARLSRKAKVELALCADSVVLGDPVTLMQVLMNLLTNASDALGGEAGTIGVKTSQVKEPDARFQRALGVPVGPGEWLLVEVSDTGEGMDAATRARVFEPFFTSKHQGHGLGLAACLGIVKAHDGAVLVESELGQGSRFSLLLPRANAVSAHASLEPQNSIVKPCRVLVVDDEASVRTHVRRVLERQGYSVEEAVDGRSGILAFERSAPDVLFLDMTMPEVDGAEVVRHIRGKGSLVPIVISSGYLAADLEQKLDRSTFQEFLCKPFGNAELLEAIARAQLEGVRLQKSP